MQEINISDFEFDGSELERMKDPSCETFSETNTFFLKSNDIHIEDFTQSIQKSGFLSFKYVCQIHELRFIMIAKKIIFSLIKK